MSKYLLEVGVEELPYKFIPMAIEQLERGFKTFLDDNKVKFDRIKVMATPRRLAVLIEGLAATQPDVEKVVKGPIAKVAFDENNKLTKAGEGFANKNGIGADELYIEDNYVYAKISIKGKNTKDLLQENVPVIFTSARDQDLDKILGLELGSDDYITKPYSSKELVLRVDKILKRVYKDTKSQIITYECYKIDTDKRVVLGEKEKEIKLTTLEFDLLLLLIQNRNKCFSREEILDAVWGNDYFGTDRVVDDLVRRLRKKRPKLNVNAVYGYGYRLS